MQGRLVSGFARSQSVATPNYVAATFLNAKFLFAPKFQGHRQLQCRDTLRAFELSVAQQ